MKIKGFGDVSVNIDAKAIEEWAKRENEIKQAAIKRAISQHADKVLATAHEECPKVSGNLDSTLHVKISKSGFGATIRTDSDKAFYGRMVHFGTKKLTGNPFLYRANDRHRAELAPAIQKACDES